MKLNKQLINSAALAVLLFCAGCKDKEEIKVYRVSKEPPPAAMPTAEAGGTGGGMGAMPGMGGQQFASEPTPDITSEAPAGWDPQPPSAMRLASYLVKGDNGASADVSLIALGGPAGGALENVNRWLGQIGQAAITEEKLAETAKHIASAFGDVLVVDLAGLPSGADATKDGRIIAGIASSDGRTFFFKIRGNANLVGAQKDAFIKWIGSVRFEESATGAASPPADEPAAPMKAAAGMEKPQVTWQAPANWKTEQASSMRFASFSVAGADGGKGDISVSVFPGDTGGDLANVNRWRSQVGLEPLAEGDLKSLVTKVSSPGGEFQLVDLSGKTSRVLAGWRLVNGSTWFFKLSGPDAVVGAEKDNFTKFLQSVEFKP
jgi:hypothetical protein